MRYPPLVLCIFVLISCIQEVSIPIPQPEPRLVVNCLFNPDSTWKINVSQTGMVSDTSFQLPHINTASVELWEDGNFLGKATYTQNGDYRLNKYPAEGKIYRVRVAAPGLSSVEAVDSIPSFPAVTGGFWDLSASVPLIDPLGGVYSSFLLGCHFTDPQGEKNYYHLNIAMHDSCLCYYPEEQEMILDRLYNRLISFNLDIDEPLADINAKKTGVALFSDISFDGDVRNLSFFLDTTQVFYALTLYPDSLRSDSRIYGGYPGSPRKYVKIYTDLRSLSQSLYLFEASFFEQGFLYSDPFSVYRNVYSNVEGGLGIFAGYQRKLIEIYSD